MERFLSLFGASGSSTGDGVSPFEAGAQTLVHMPRPLHAVARMASGSQSSSNFDVSQCCLPAILDSKFSAQTLEKMGLCLTCYSPLWPRDGYAAVPTVKQNIKEKKKYHKGKELAGVEHAEQEERGAGLSEWVWAEWITVRRK
ncbi:hypothetical protein B0H13DRAFT_1856272 [Mycena leptocephala]|nr:hypothetical protein B0H13DRAFT_1856272 [Mycena leptocephala]